jgi:signal transduction histidine kinase/ActR/RegA family two-component response regulator
VIERRGAEHTQQSVLANTCALIDALLNVVAAGYGTDKAGDEARLREATRVLDHLALPAALLTIDGQVAMKNVPWTKQLVPTPARILERIAPVAQGNDTVQESEICVDAGKRRRYYTAMLQPRQCDGVPSSVLVVCIDVTEQVITRKLNLAPDTLVWSGALSQPADYWNEPWQRAVGPVTEWSHAIHAADLTRCHQALTQAVRRRTSAEIDARIRRATSDYRWYRVRFVVDPDESRWYGTAVDINDAHAQAAEREELLAAARAARADAEQANRLKDEFLATVSHELRAPVTTMLLWERVLREHHDPASRAQALDAIRQSALAQSRLVGDLLDVARAVSGKLYVDMRPVAVGPLITDALEAAIPSALARGLLLSHKVTRTSVVEGDVARLRQVLDNLLANAIKFTDRGGRVMLSTQRDDNMLMIEVQDTGRGIAPELLERIFEPFHQAEDALTRRYGGLGLGLAISRQLVQLHGGTLVAASPGPGKGATMTIRLPLSRKRLRAETPRPGGRPVRALEDKHVLVVDDDPRVRDALVLLLQRAGATVEPADSAANARKLIHRRTPDVIVCDIAMPLEDGYGFIRSLRASGIRIPAIALTALALEVDANRATEAGFNLHLAKPVNFERLVSSIGSVLERDEPSA